MVTRESRAKQRDCMDLKQRLVEIGNPKVPFEPDQEHNAVSDAEWNRRVFAWIESLSG